MSAISRGRTRATQRPGRPGRTGSVIGGIVGGRPGRGGRRGRGFRIHRRGITATELRGFNKVVRLLRKVGMVPKGTRRAPPRRGVA